MTESPVPRVMNAWTVLSVIGSHRRYALPHSPRAIRKYIPPPPPVQYKPVFHCVKSSRTYIFQASANDFLNINMCRTIFMIRSIWLLKKVWCCWHQLFDAAATVSLSNSFGTMRKRLYNFMGMLISMRVLNCYLCTVDYFQIRHW